MSFYYNTLEICCNYRGLLHRYIDECTDAQQWIFLDADILALAPFDAVFDQLKDATLLVTAHLNKPLDIKNAPGIEKLVLATGICNLGFLGVRRCDESKKFIDWFCARLERFAFSTRWKDVWFVDQKWINLALTAFKDVQFTNCKAINIDHWNFAHAPLTRSPEGNYYYDGERLIFFTLVDGMPIIRKNYPDTEKALRYLLKATRPGSLSAQIMQRKCNRAK